MDKSSKRRKIGINWFAADCGCVTQLVVQHIHNESKQVEFGLRLAAVQFDSAALQGQQSTDRASNKAA